jgi:hypothetical protein
MTRTDSREDTRTEMSLTLAETEDLDPAIHLYRDAFTELNRLTVQNHMMSIPEFEAMAADTRIRKYTEWDAAGEMVGLSVMTNQLAAWPYVSAPYFEHHYPDLYDRGAIWYIGFVCAAKTAPRETFSRLIAAMMGPIRESRGMGVLDYSAYVMNPARHLDRSSKAIIGRIAPLRSATEIDSQHYIAYDFDWPAA